MNSIKTLLLLMLLAAISTTAFARKPYQCHKIRYSNFNPKHKSDVAPGSKFSFTASKEALPNSIRVKVKKTKVDVKIEKKGDYYKVTGRLPADIENTFARIAILGNAVMDCETKGGWLVNITGADGGEATKQADSDPVEKKVEAAAGTAVKDVKTVVD